LFISTSIVAGLQSPNIVSLALATAPDSAQLSARKKMPQSDGNRVLPTVVRLETPLATPASQEQK
jgi:hypothetical protein